jgi:hypothetical protein
LNQPHGREPQADRLLGLPATHPRLHRQHRLFTKGLGLYVAARSRQLGSTCQRGGHWRLPQRPGGIGFHDRRGDHAALKPDAWRRICGDAIEQIQ